METTHPSVVKPLANDGHQRHFFNMKEFRPAWAKSFTKSFKRAQPAL